MTFDKFVEHILFGISVLLLSVSGNYVGETLGYQLQHILSHNMFVKHMVVLFIIFFSTSLSNDIVHPFIRIVITLIIWTFYLFISKLSIKGAFTVFILLFIATIIHTFQEYAEKETKVYSIWNIMYMIIFLSIVVICFGGIIQKVK
jgi:integral membrane sensor domain MASE1